MSVDKFNNGLAKKVVVRLCFECHINGLSCSHSLHESIYGPIPRWLLRIMADPVVHIRPDQPLFSKASVVLDRRWTREENGYNLAHLCGTRSRAAPQPSLQGHY